MACPTGRSAATIWALTVALLAPMALLAAGCRAEEEEAPPTSGREQHSADRPAWESWRRFPLGDGLASVELPAKPERRLVPVRAGGEVVEVEHLVVEMDGGATALVASFACLPAEAGRSEAEAVEEAADEYIARLAGRVTRRSPVELAGRRGVELAFRRRAGDQALDGVVRVIVAPAEGGVADRACEAQYLVQAVTTPGQSLVTPRQRERFLSSLALSSPR